jgi:hypothetical protein
VPSATPASSDPAHLAENIAAGSLHLAPVTVAALGQLTAPGTVVG